jgi:hypothetical protein
VGNKTYLLLGLGAVAAFFYIRKKAKSVISDAVADLASLSPLTPDFQLNAAEFVNYAVTSDPATRVTIDSLSVVANQPDVVVASYSDELYTVFDFSQPNRGMIKINGKGICSEAELMSYFGYMPELTPVEYFTKTWTKNDYMAAGLGAIGDIPDDLQMTISLTAQNDKIVDLSDIIVSSSGGIIDAENITSISCFDFIMEVSGGGLGSLGVETFIFRLPNSQEIAAFVVGVSTV